MDADLEALVADAAQTADDVERHTADLEALAIKTQQHVDGVAMAITAADIEQLTALLATDENERLDLLMTNNEMRDRIRARLAAAPPSEGRRGEAMKSLFEAEETLELLLRDVDAIGKQITDAQARLAAYSGVK